MREHAANFRTDGKPVPRSPATPASRPASPGGDESADEFFHESAHESARVERGETWPLHRHDLVWLDPDCAEVTSPDPALLRDWLHRRLPLVVGRQEQPAGGVRLGFTLPGTGMRRRVEARAPHAAIREHRAPPTLAELLGHSPAAWQEQLAAIVSALRQCDCTPRVYGSLLTQALTGEACVRPHSDVDLLIDCEQPDMALSALRVLTQHADALPRLDGEIRMRRSWSVAWRELAQALAGNRLVLAKSDRDLRLMRAVQFLGDAFPIGVDHGNPCGTPALSAN